MGRRPRDGERPRRPNVAPSPWSPRQAFERADRLARRITPGLGPRPPSGRDPHDIALRLSIALTHGTPLADVERLVTASGLIAGLPRLLAELLAELQKRSQATTSHPSRRLEAFLERW